MTARMTVGIKPTNQIIVSLVRCDSRDDSTDDSTGDSRDDRKDQTDEASRRKFGSSQRRFINRNIKNVRSVSSHQSIGTTLAEMSADLHFCGKLRKT